MFSPCAADYLSRIGRLEFRTEVRVLQKGMGKLLTVKITNNGDLEKQCAVSYYTEPVLSWDRSTTNCGAALSYRRGKNRIFIKNRTNPEFDGEAVIACRTPDGSDCALTCDRERFLAGEVNGEVRSFAGSCAGGMTS